MQRSLPVSLCWSLVWISLAIAAVPTAAATPPNVVFIMADDLGWGELGCYGQKIIRTPHIDSLATAGMRFTQFYSGNAVCAPSRCCLMTGMHPGHAYIRDNGNPKGMEDLKQKFEWEFPGQHPIPADSVTVAKLFRAAGYATGAMGKWGLGHCGTPGDVNAQGFDLFYGYHCQVHAHNHYPKFLWRNQTKELLPGNDATLSGAVYSQDRFIEEAIAFVENNKSKPFFLYLPFAVPHLSIQVPQHSTDEYTGVIAEAQYKHTAYLQHPTPRAAYAGMLTHLDRGVGQILNKLDELQLSDNTIVIFTSDNGPTYDRLGGSDSEYFRSAGDLRGLKGSLYEGGIRVPLLIRWPKKIAAGTTTDWPGALWDFMPTLCALTDIKTPRNIDGVSFAPLLLGDPQPEREFLYWESPGYGSQQAVRAGKWKAVRQQMGPKSRKKQPITTELYDLTTDETESRDVASDHPEIVRKLENIMTAEHVPSSLFRLPGVDQ
jgi:arylsulfatase A